MSATRLFDPAAGAPRSRREFLRLSCLAAGLAGVACALQACGGAPASAPTTSPPASALSPSAPPPKPGAASTQPSSKPAASPAGSSPPAAGASQPGMSLKVDWAPVAVVSPLWVADAVHAFADRGLSVTLTNLAASAVVPALVAREVDVWMASAGPVLVADLNGHLDLTYLGATVTGNTASLYVKESIHSAAELRGKTLATDRPGTPTDYFTNVALSLVGLKPADVVLRPLGTTEINFQALVSGQVDGAALVVPFSFAAEGQGFRDLADTFDTPYLTNGPVVLRSRIDELAPAMPSFLAALRQGIETFNKQPDVAMQAIQKFTGVSDKKALQKTYDFFQTKRPFNASLDVKTEHLQGMLDFLAGTTVPAAKNAKPEQFFDTRFLSKLPK